MGAPCRAPWEFHVWGQFCGQPEGTEATQSRFFRHPVEYDSPVSGNTENNFTPIFLSWCNATVIGLRGYTDFYFRGEWPNSQKGDSFLGPLRLSADFTCKLKDIQFSHVKGVQPTHCQSP